MTSTRLPGKVMMKINNKSVIDHVFDRAKMSKLLSNCILATTTNSTDDILVEWAIKNNIDYYRGSEHDVLDRFYQSAKYFKVDVIVRVTSDCPLLSPSVVDKVITTFLESECDYASNVHPPTYPDGLDVEVFSFECLEKAWLSANKESEREHVTPYMYTSGKFKLKNVKGEEDYSKFRFTIDRIEDLEFLNTIVSLCTSEKNLENLIQVVKNNADILKINHHIARNENLKL